VKPARPCVQASPLRVQRGGTLVGLMVGLVLGLAVAVGVALFVTQGPLPFVNKVGKAADKVGETKAGAELPDPNKGLAGKAKGMVPDPALETKGADAGTEQREAETRADAKAEGRAAEGKAAEARPADARPADAKAADAKAAEPRPPDPVDPATGERPSYLVQAGAFRTLDDAEAMRARLALLGYETRVLSADVNGYTIYRVRLGPYPRVDDANQIRSRLADNGVESAVVRLR